MVEKYDTVQVNNVVRGKDTNGEPTVTLTPAFRATALAHDVANPLKLQDQYRLYTSFANFVLQYTPRTFTMGQTIENYSFNWRGQNWRIMDAFEIGREKIRFLCAMAAPSVKV